ncbi:Glutamine synthetase, beta-Grasp [Corchorus olitorius]|uniref:Glutamine synthetase, beta-Grasp n=1 Tax=Corchorus olitorius TaxID=93759 RepID=A0A1R3FUA2_9ROSI|nr:Glutamine synthetase, beta-Grasp [Corchorus olitorius]
MKSQRKGTKETLSGPVSDPSKLPKWNYDGSSTGQAPGEDSEVNLIVMFDAYTPAAEPTPTNKRCAAAKISSHPDVVAEEPWYFEISCPREYTLLQKDVKWPLGWPVGGYPEPQVIKILSSICLFLFNDHQWQPKG